MNLSAPFVARPVATLLMAAAVVVAGVAAWRALPVAALPRVEFPVVLVSAQLPGASAEIMANTVALPLAREFSTLPGVRSVAAANLEGSTTIILEFSLRRPIDHAASDVQAAIARVSREFPAALPSLPTYRKFNPADAPVLMLALRGGNDMAELDAAARRLLVPALSSIDGVGQVVVQGGRKYAVRIQADPGALAARGIGIDELEQAVRRANAFGPLGRVEQGEARSSITAVTQFGDAAAFRDLVIAARAGRAVRLGDVAKVLDSVENDETAAWHDGNPAITLAVHRESAANAVEVARRVKAGLPRLAADLVPDATISVVNDQSGPIRAAVHDLQLTLALAVVLLAGVIWMFGGGLSRTLSMAFVLVLSIAGTLAVMMMLGFSLNAISLLALTLSVGLVIDDAMVMHEGIQRGLEQGLSPREAALRGAAEMGFTIVAITASFVAAFLPALLMDGLVGRILQEFAATTCVALVISAVAALTVTPALAAALPRPTTCAGRRVDDRLTRAYGIALDLVLRRRGLVIVLFLCSVAGTVWLAKALPKGFFPQEDLGQVTVTTEARQDVPFRIMADLQARAAKRVLASPHVAHVVSTVGAGAAVNEGRLHVELKPRAERGGLDDVLRDLRSLLDGDPQLVATVTPVQNMRAGRQSRSRYQLAVQGTDLAELDLWSSRIAARMAQDPAFVGVTTDTKFTAVQIALKVDRDRAAIAGVSADQMRSTLHAAFGPRQVATIQGTSDTYQVFLELDPRFAGSVMDTLRIRSDSGKLVPLSAVATVSRVSAPSAIHLLGQLPAITVSFDLTAGASLGRAVETVDHIKQEIGLPAAVSADFTGTARAFREASGGQLWLVIGALVAVYLILGMLYESLLHPLTIMAGLPSAALGALAALWIAGFELDVAGVVAVILLIGIVKKNAIMMIDAAMVRRRTGATAEVAIREACLRRLRPITMTTLAAMAGAVPLTLQVGAGAELRQPLGLAVLGGLALSQPFTLLVTPVLFLSFERLKARAVRWADRGEARAPT